LRELDSTSLIELAAVLAAVLPLNLLGARLEERVECPITPPGRGSDTESGFPAVFVGWTGLVGDNPVGSGISSVGVCSFSVSIDEGGEAVMIGSVGVEESTLREPAGSITDRTGNVPLIRGAKWGEQDIRNPGVRRINVRIKREEKNRSTSHSERERLYYQRMGPQAERR
jgi:hypothetical protein